MLEHKDGTVVDTSALAKSVKSLPLPSGATLRLQSIYKTASGLRAKCVAANVNRGLSADPGYEGGPLDPGSEVDSPYIDFDVKPTVPEAEEEKPVPKPELCKPLCVFLLPIERTPLTQDLFTLSNSKRLQIPN